MKCLLLLFSLLFIPGLHAQYAPPLRGPLLVTGTFGELRSDHFHGGLDFRAKVGTPVYAVNDGYVSRVKVSGGGYGQAVYIDHPDGRRSVYGHLEVLAPELLDTVRGLQYRREQFEVDLAPDPTAFPVKKGQLIGGVGNRGYSFGPHLHFEIRESEGDVPLNPLSLGFEIADTRTPQLRQLRVYELDVAGRALSAQTFDLIAGSLVDTVMVSSAKVAVGINAYDRQDAMPNRNGIYRAGMRVDSNDRFSFVYDRIPYDKTEYLNALTDFAEWKTNSSWFYLLYARSPAAVFWPGGDPEADGVIDLTPGQPVRVSVTAADFAGNEAVIEMVLLLPAYFAPASPPLRKHLYELPAGEPSVIDTGDMRLEIDSNGLYGELLFEYAHQFDGSDGYLGETHHLHDETVPLHGKANLYLQLAKPLADSLRQRVYIARCGSSRGQQSVGGQWQPDGSMLARIGSFGDYVMAIDTVAPTIRIERFGTDLRRATAFSLLLDDAVGGELTYRGMVDGEWILMEYDAKSGRLSHNFSEGRIGRGLHDFSLIVSDKRGNQALFERKFRR